jgi:hypothetical protein
MTISIIHCLRMGFTLIFPLGLALGQTRPQASIEKFENRAVLIHRFRFETLPDTAQPHVFLGGNSIGPTPFSVFLGLGNSGTLLAFSDSLAKKPHPIEKRRHFPFFWLLPHRLYEIEVAATTGEDGYIAARLLEMEPVVRVVDEIWICAPIRHYPLPPVSWIGSKWKIFEPN